MNKDYQLYELSEAQQRAVMGLQQEDETADGFDEEEIAVLREDVARLNGYLKGRADSDKAGPSRPNADLTRRRADGKP